MTRYHHTKAIYGSKSFWWLSLYQTRVYRAGRQYNNRALAFLSLASHKLLNKQSICRRFMTQLDSLFNLNNKESIKALHYIDGLAQACSNAMELQQSCTKPSICLRDRNPPVTRNASNDNRVTMSWHHHGRKQFRIHYNYVIMGAIGSQITSLTIVYLIVYSDADQRKHQSSASLAFVRGIHRGPVNSPHKWPVTRKMFPFDDAIMTRYHHTKTIYGSKSFWWLSLYQFRKYSFYFMRIDWQDSEKKVWNGDQSLLSLLCCDLVCR